MTIRGNNRFKQVGLDRCIRIEWLKQTANMVLAGNDKNSIKAFLQELIQDQFPSSNKKVRGSVDKTITILMRVWVNPPKDLRDLQADGLKLLQNMTKEDHLAIHWGMIMAVYPFWGSVAANVGRSLNLQGNVVATQIQRRVREKYGERETVSRRARYLLRAFIAWEVLKETSVKGIYDQGVSQSIDDHSLIAWMIEAFLHSRSNAAASVKEVFASTSLFPFNLQRLPTDHLIALSDHLNVLRHGIDQDLIILSEPSKSVVKKSGL